MGIQSIGLAAVREASLEVDRAAVNVRRAAQPPPEDPTEAVSEDRVELSDAAVQLLLAQRGHQAGIELIRTADEIAQDALDLLG